MMRNEKKETLDDLLFKTGQWAALELLKGKTLNQRVIALCDLVESCARQHDDERALEAFGWYMQAIDETMPAPADAKGEQKRLEQLAQVQSYYAQPFFQRLPPTRAVQGVEWVDDDSRRSCVVQGPTLLKTKERALHVVADAWRIHSDNVEADKHFAFLLEAEERGRDEDKAIVGKIVRKVTDQSFPLDRLVYTMRQHPKSHGDILGIAWVKKCAYQGHDNSGAGLILGVVGNFHDASPTATEFLGILAGQVRVLEMQLKRIKGLPWPYEVVYVTLTEVVIRFKTKGSQEKELHSAFESARDKIVDAKKTGELDSNIRVRLHGLLVERYSDKTVAQRVDDF